MKNNYTSIKKNLSVLLLFAASIISMNVSAQCSATGLKVDAYCPESSAGCTGLASCSFVASNPSFNWSDGTTNQSIYPACAGTYTLTLTDGSCTTTTTVTVLAPADFSITTTKSDPSSCVAANGSVGASVTGGTGTLTYSWSSGSSNPSSTNLIAATYTLVVTDARSCATSTTVTLSCTTGMNDGKNIEMPYSIYPNPANNVINLDFNGSITGKAVITVANVLGTELINSAETISANSFNYRIDVSTLPKGVYFIKVENENKKFVTTFVKN